MSTLVRYSVYKGSVFTNLLGGLKLYKLTNKEEKHNSVQYKTGLNVDVLQWNPSGKGCAGGLYFFDEIQLLDYTKYVDASYYIRPVTLLNYSDVYVEKGKYKVHEFVLGERKRWDHNPVRWVEWSSHYVCSAALSRNQKYIRYVPREYINYTMCINAVKDCGNNLKYVPTILKTKELCTEAIGRCDKEFLILRYIPKSIVDHNLLERCIEMNGRNIKYAKRNKHLTEEMCIESVRSDGNNIKYVPFSLLSEKVCLEAVKNKSFVIEYIPNKKRTLKVCEEAVSRYSFNIKHVPDEFITEEMCLHIVKKLGYCISYIPIQYITASMCKIAVLDNPSNIVYVPLKYRNSIV